MHHIQKTIAIDIRLLGKKRTGDEMVFFHLTKEVLNIDTKNQYHLLTDETDPEKLTLLAERLACTKKHHVNIISLSSKNRFTWNLWVLPRYLFQHQIDVLHTQYILPLCFPRRTKVALHIHDVSFRAYPQLIHWSDRFFLALLIGLSLKRATMILTPSQFTKDEIIKYYAVTDTKITVLPNAVGEEFLHHTPANDQNTLRIKKKYRLPEHFILALGTLQPRKNIPFLLSAFAELQKRLRDTTTDSISPKLVLAGNRNAHHIDTIIDKSISEHHMEDAVLFPGFIDHTDLPSVIGLADIFVFPSLYEGFGIPLLEAMSQGVAVAASDIPSLRSVGGDGALYFDPTDIASCAEILYTLLIDSEQKKLLIQRGYERLKFFSWQKSAQLLNDVYNKM